jgi:NADH dehydrogenase
MKRGFELCFQVKGMFTKYSYPKKGTFGIFGHMNFNDWNETLDMRSFWARQSQTVLLTGAHTALGHSLAERLCGAGWIVRILTPVGSMGLSAFPSHAFEVEGSLASVDSLALAIRDCTKVIHLAEKSLGKDDAAFRLENVEYTRNLVQACKQHKVPQFILISSSAVDYRTMTQYGRSKKIAEDVVRGSDLNWTIVRPSLMVGPNGSPEYRWLRALVRRFPILVLPEGGHTVKKPIHEDDLVDGLDLLLRANPLGIAKRTYSFAGREQITLADLVQFIASEHRLTPRMIVTLPNWIIAWGAKLLDRFGRFPFRSTEALLAISQDASPSIDAAYQDFGYRPRPLAGRLATRNISEQTNSSPISAPAIRVTRGFSLVRSNR